MDNILLGAQVAETKYEIIESVLGGIYSAEVGYSDEIAILNLKKDLQFKPFKDSFLHELTEAFQDNNISWCKLLEDCHVGIFDTEIESKKFVQKFLWDVAFNHKNT